MNCGWQNASVNIERWSWKMQGRRPSGEVMCAWCPPQARSYHFPPLMLDHAGGGEGSLSERRPLPGPPEGPLVGVMPRLVRLLLPQEVSDACSQPLPRLEELNQLFHLDAIPLLVVTNEMVNEAGKIFEAPHRDPALSTQRVPAAASPKNVDPPNNRFPDPNVIHRGPEKRSMIFSRPKRVRGVPKKKRGPLNRSTVDELSGPPWTNQSTNRGVRRPGRLSQNGYGL